MKRFLKTLALMLALCLIASVPAFAITAQYNNTQKFLDALDENNFKYTYKGVDNNNREKVVFPYSGDNIECDVQIAFSDDEEDISICVWNVIDFDKKYLAGVIDVIDTLNYKYRFVKLYADRTDWSVTAYMDLIVRQNADVGDIAVEGVARMLSILEDEYPALKVYAN